MKTNVNALNGHPLDPIHEHGCPDCSQSTLRYHWARQALTRARHAGANLQERCFALVHAEAMRESARSWRRYEAAARIAFTP